MVGKADFGTLQSNLRHIFTLSHLLWHVSSHREMMSRPGCKKFLTFFRQNRKIILGICASYTAGRLLLQLHFQECYLKRSAVGVITENPIGVQCIFANAMILPYTRECK